MPCASCSNWVRQPVWRSLDDPVVALLQLQAGCSWRVDKHGALKITVCPTCDNLLKLFAWQTEAVTQTDKEALQRIETATADALRLVVGPITVKAGRAKAASTDEQDAARRAGCDPAADM